MESTFPHSAGQGSIPQDYSILKRYAHSRGLDPTDLHSDENHDSDNEDDELEGSSSHTVHHIGHVHFHGKIDPPNIQESDELTPLLSNSHGNDSSTSLHINHDDDRESLVALFWEELRILTRYSLPVYGTQLLEYSLMVCSVLSIGHISTTALAAITLGSMTASVSGLSIIQGMTSALDTMLPPAWTSSDPRQVGLWTQRMTVLMAFCLVPILTIWFNAEQILLGLKQDPEVARLAAVYLRWISLGLPAYAFNYTSRRYFQSQGLFSVPTRIIIIVSPINALLNYILVWGPDAVRLGFIGAPIATAISFNLIALLSVLYGTCIAPHTAWHPISRKSFSLSGLGILLKLGLAGVAQTASEWWAWELVALAASLISPVALATQSVLLVSASTAFQAPFSLGIAASVRIGNLLGERKARRARASSNTALIMAILIACINSTVFVISRNQWGYLFNNDPEVVDLVGKILPLVALFQVFDSLSAVAGGILRARGMQVAGALLNLSAYYIIGIPLGMILTFPSNPFPSIALGLHGLWMGLTISLVYTAAFGAALCIRSDWEREVEKAAERLNHDGDVKSPDLEV